MDINYVNDKLIELDLAEAKLLKDQGYEKLDDMDSKSYFKRRSIQHFSELKIACIMDEFTFNSYNPECIVKQLTPSDWRKELESFNPDFFFLESAWGGKDQLWNTQIAYFSEGLLELLSYCKKHNIPTVFWNKEDPVHFETFISVAKHIDFVFTTDIDCIRSYKQQLGHDRVFLLPFAAQTKYHNPVELDQRENKFSFAGAYYRRYPERVKDFESIVNTVGRNKTEKLDIFDRNFKNKKSPYKFPRKYSKFIRGNLSPSEISKAYKGYRYSINMNSVKQSQSMCARRVFELLASNTVVISNYSRAVRNMFGDLVICTDDATSLEQQLENLSSDSYYKKFRLLGLRKVLLEHTYQERLVYLINTIYKNKYELKNGSIAVIGRVESKEDFEHLVNNYNKQSYKETKLFLITNTKLYFDASALPKGIEFVNKANERFFDQLKDDFSYITFFSNQDYYGENYLLDLWLGYKYTDYSVITKGMHYYQENGKIICEGEHKSYIEIERAHVRRSLLKSMDFSCSELEDLSCSIEEATIRIPSFSVDEFNYCMDYPEIECGIVDDIRCRDTGVSMERLLNATNRIPSERSLGSKTDTFETELKGTFVGKSNILLVADHYPNYDDLYRYAFVHNRVIEYKKRGLLVDVFKINERYPDHYYEFDGIDVSSGYSLTINNALLYGEHDTVLIHFLSEKLWDSIKDNIRGKRVLIWVHGSDIQTWWRRDYNYSTSEQIKEAKITSENKLKFWKGLFEIAQTKEDYNLHFIFVSRYLASTSFEDIGIRLEEEKYSIVHNFINGENFDYIEKSPEMRKRVLTIRPFNDLTYANDLTIKAIIKLSKEPFFKELHFHIVGKGKLFKDLTRPLRKFKNVTLDEKFLRSEEISHMHKNYGIFLVPTRMDSQGVSRDESMSSGLVPITTKVAAVPEFVDDTCGILVAGENYEGLAKGIKTLYNDPQLFNVLSKKAAERVRNQSGYSSTIQKELHLIQNKNN